MTIKLYLEIRNNQNHPLRRKTLKKLNTPKFNSSKDYKFVPESELWANRNKNYKYWL